MRQAMSAALRSRTRSLAKVAPLRLALIALTSLSLQCDGGGQPDRAQREAAPVEVTKVSASTMQRVVRSVGTLRATGTVAIRSEQAAIISKVLFEEGEEVEAGDVLFELESEVPQQQLQAQRAALEGARARLKQARLNLERVRELYEREAITQARLEEARATVDDLEAQADQIRAQIASARETLEKTKIEAPEGGQISEAAVEAGDFVSVGQQLATLYAGAAELSFSIPARHAPEASAGQRVRAVFSLFPERVFSGEVTFVAPALDPLTRELLLKSRIDSPEVELLPGAFADVELVISLHQDTPAVPEQALVGVSEGYVVWVVKGDNTVERRPVEVGLREPGRAEITKGLQVGETVVVAGQMRLNEGAEVVVHERDEVDSPLAPGDARQNVSGQKSEPSSAEPPGPRDRSPRPNAPP